MIVSSVDHGRTLEMYNRLYIGSWNIRTIRSSQRSIREIKHYNLEVLRHSESKVRMKGKQIDVANYVYTRVLEGGTISGVWE